MTTNIWLSLGPSYIMRACAEGGGDEIDLPAVPDDALEANIIVARRVLADPFDDDSLLEDIARQCTKCSECGATEPIDSCHAMAGEYVLIGCEGYHTPLLRAIYATRLLPAF